MMRRTVFAAAVATAALCGSQVALAGAAAAAKQPTALGSGGAAASVDPLATRAAISVLRRGGNAADAAIAAASVLGVVEPYSCGVGGGGFMVIRDGLTGQITTVGSREKAPAAIRPDSFFINGQPPTDAQFPINRYSGLSVGVPGTPAAWSYALRHYGTYRLRDACATASGSRAPASRSTRRSSTRRSRTSRTSTTCRRRRRSTSTRTTRPATSAARSPTPTS